MKIIQLISDSNGELSSSRLISIYLSVWLSIHVSVCTYFGFTSLLSGGDIALILLSVFGVTAAKKPFESSNSISRRRDV